MAKQATVEVEVEETNNSVQSAVVDNVHKVFLVGLGAAAMAQDEIVNLIGKFAEQGEQTEQKVRESLNEMTENRKKQAEEAKQKAGDVNKKAEEEMKNRMESALNRFNIPSRTEIKALDEKISTLSEKIDELNKETAK
jgi:poly(hydroxyalkanoate) granule-associated protein